MSLKIQIQSIALAGLKMRKVGPVKIKKIQNQTGFTQMRQNQKLGRKIACNLAKANAKTDIAGEIATKINAELTSEMSGLFYR